MSKHITKEEFISLADIQHHYFYNYSSIVYKNKESMLNIVCPTT